MMASTQVCSCGQVFMPEALFCRRCGAKRSPEVESIDVHGAKMVSSTLSLGSQNFSASEFGMNSSWQVQQMSPLAETQPVRQSTPYRSQTLAPVRVSTTPPHSPAVTSRNAGLAFSPSVYSQQVRVPAVGIPAITTVQQLMSPTATLAADANQPSPALRAWIESQVDTRVEQVAASRIEQAFRQIAAGELSNVASVVRREAQGAAQIVEQQAGERERRLESEVRCMWEAQARVLALFEGISRDADKFFNNNKSRSEALTTVEKVMSTIDDLQRTVEQDGDGAAAKLRQHEAAIIDLRRTQAEELVRQRAALAELQRLQGEASMRQRQNSDEAVGTSSMIASTRQEVADLAQLVQRLEQKLFSWRAELAAEVADEVRAIASARDAESESERLKLDALQRESREARSTCGELEGRVEGFRIELSAVLGASNDLEQRLKETQQQFARRVESLLSEPVKEVESLRQEVSTHLQRLEQRSSTWRTEVSKEIRSVSTGRDQEAREMTSRFEELRREAVLSNARHTEVEGRMERLQVDLATLNESLPASVPEELAALQRRLTAEMRAETRAALKSEQSAIAAIDEQLWLTDQRLGQRIDEVVHAQERTAVMLQVNEGRAAVIAREGASPSQVRAAEILIEELRINAESSSFSTRRRPGADTVYLSASSGDAEQLERLRSARKQRTTGAHSNGFLATETIAEEGSRLSSSRDGHSTLTVAREAAEAFEELGKGL